MLRPSVASILILLAVAAVAGADDDTGQVTSLREGNRLYREGRLEEAHQAYAAGFDPAAPHPVLAYNMGTTSHQLGRLPEAILWYRRAEATNPSDPWLAENLTLARTTLGLMPYPAPGLTGLIVRHRAVLLLLGAVLACIGVGLWIARPRRSTRGAFSLLGIGVAFYALILIAGSAAPQAAVVLQDCSGSAGDLPAGSEVWVGADHDTAYELRAGEATISCPRASVALVAGNS